MNIKSQILDAIDDINLITSECEYNTICEMYNSYDKAAMILEYYEGEDVSSFNVFDDTHSFYQESSVSDKMKKSGAKYNTLMKILTFIPRLIKALFETISEKLKKTKPSKELQQSPKETKEAFVEIFDKKKDKKKRIAAILKVLGVAGVVGGAVAGVRHISKSVISDKLNKIVSRVDNELHSLMEIDGNYNDSNYLRDFAMKLNEYKSEALKVADLSLFEKGKYLERARMMVNLSHDLERIINDYKSDSIYIKERANVVNLSEYKKELSEKFEKLKKVYKISTDVAFNATISEMYCYCLDNLIERGSSYTEMVTKYASVLNDKIENIDKKIQKELSKIVKDAATSNSDNITNFAKRCKLDFPKYMEKCRNDILDEYYDITESFDKWVKYASNVKDKEIVIDGDAVKNTDKRQNKQSTQQTKQHDSRIPDPSFGGKILLNEKEKTPEEIEKYYEEAERFLEEYDKKHEALKKHLKQHMAQSNVYDDIKFSIGYDESKDEIVYNIIPPHNIPNKINLILRGIMKLYRNNQNIKIMNDKEKANFLKDYINPDGDYNMEHISKLSSGANTVGTSTYNHSSNPLNDIKPASPEKIMEGINSDCRAIEKMINNEYEPAIKNIAEVGEDVFPQTIIKWLNDAKNEITQLRNLFQEYTDFVVGVVNDVNKIYASMGIAPIPVKGDNK